MPRLVDLRISEVSVKAVCVTPLSTVRVAKEMFIYDYCCEKCDDTQRLSSRTGSICT